LLYKPNVLFSLVRTIRLADGDLREYSDLLRWHDGNGRITA